MLMVVSGMKRQFLGSLSLAVWGADLGFFGFCSLFEKRGKPRPESAWLAFGGRVAIIPRKPGRLAERRDGDRSVKPESGAIPRVRLSLKWGAFGTQREHEGRGRKGGD